MTSIQTTPGQSLPQTVRVGVIGCGRRFYNAVLPGLISQAPFVRITHIYDPNPDSLAFTRDLTGISGFEAVGDYRDIAAHPEIDWVMIGSWNAQHEEHILACLRHGKHIFVEKPLATTIDGCRRIREAAVTHSGTVSVGFVLRYSPYYRKIREIIQQGRIGRVMSFEFNETLGFNEGGHIMRNWRRKKENSGGHILEKCCHDFDLANWFTGSLPIHAASFGSNDYFLPKNQHHIQRLGKDANGRDAYFATGNPINFAHPFTGDHDVVDNQVAILQYANGARATFHTNIHSGILERRFYIIGEEGAIRADCIKGTVELGRVGFNECVESIPVQTSFYDTHMTRELAACMQGRGQSAVGLLAGIASSVACLACEQARETLSVVDLRPIWQSLNMNPELQTP